MTNKMEDILGLGSFDKERIIPGSIKSNDREYIYLLDPKDEEFEALFKKVVRHVTPPLMKGGGVGIEGCEITLPNGDVFQAISYKGDIDGWRKQISEGAKAYSLKTAALEGEIIKIVSGEEYRLSECTVTFR